MPKLPMLKVTRVGIMSGPLTEPSADGKRQVPARRSSLGILRPPSVKSNPPPRRSSLGVLRRLSAGIGAEDHSFTFSSRFTDSWDISDHSSLDIVCQDTDDEIDIDEDIPELVDADMEVKNQPPQPPRRQQRRRSSVTFHDAVVSEVQQYQTHNDSQQGNLFWSYEEICAFKAEGRSLRRAVRRNSTGSLAPTMSSWLDAVEGNVTPHFAPSPVACNKESFDGFKTNTALCLLDLSFRPKVNNAVMRRGSIA